MTQKTTPTRLKVSQVAKNFENGERRVEVLRDLSFEISSGQSLAIIGPSGSGKSTLLHLIGTLDRPSAGAITLDEINPLQLAEPELAKFRNQTIGFVFQEHHLLPQYSVLENALLPALAFGKSANAVVARARELLQRVGLAHRLEHFPAELSGGERQRVAVARALVNRPRLLLCDEPTGNLDRNTAQAVAALLFELHREQNNILIIVTHSAELAAHCERRYELREGACFAV
ncbi:ABC transporter ATP-binding protein [candidate division KSB1 bacterium]|nr:ABC transporter ATP-binding protein [candidate division KSB1 bacterium]